MFVRNMLKGDLKEVMSIEQESFEYPWTELDFKQHNTRTTQFIVCVDSHNDSVMGYMVYDIHDDYYHIINLGVGKLYRRNGVATNLIRHLVEMMGKKTSVRNKISLECRESNLDAQLFYRSMGFLCTSIRKEFYQLNNEDAYSFEFYR